MHEKKSGARTGSTQHHQELRLLEVVQVEELQVGAANRKRRAAAKQLDAAIWVLHELVQVVW